VDASEYLLIVEEVPQHVCLDIFLQERNDRRWEDSAYQHAFELDTMTAKKLAAIINQHGERASFTVEAITGSAQPQSQMTPRTSVAHENAFTRMLALLLEPGKLAITADESLEIDAAGYVLIMECRGETAVEVSLETVRERIWA